MSAKDLSEMPSSPPGLKNLMPFFDKYGYSKIICTGIDLTKGSMNVYFFMHEGSVKKEETITAMFDDLNLKAPSQDHLSYFKGSGNSGSFAITLGWDMPEGQLFERCCFYIVPD